MTTEKLLPPMVTRHSSPSAAVPASVKRVLLPSSVRVTLPLPAGTAVMEKLVASTPDGVLASRSTRLLPSTLATKPRADALMRAASAAATSASGMLSRTWWL